jgi:tetratricopeptide (TPR) repeat protein
MALSFAVFAPALGGELVSDDLNAIVSNDYVTGGRSLGDIFGAFSWWGAARGDAPGYRPLTTWSFALNHDLAGLSVVSWHAVNVALHALVSWLVCLLARELGARTSVAIAAGALFAVMPIHVEAVAWVVGRAELIAASAYAAGVLCVLRYRRSGGPWRLVAAGTAIALGSFGKENAATLIAAPILASFLLPGGARERRRDRTALGALTAGMVAYAAVRLAAGGTPTTDAGGDLLDNPLSTLPLGARLIGTASVLGRYLVLSVWPRPLSIDYSYDALGIAAGFAGDRYAFITLIAIVGLAGAAFALGRGVAFALLLAATSYALVSNVVFLIGTIMAERLFYLPSLGLVLALALAIERIASPRGVARTLIVVALVCAGYGVVSYDRARDWRNAISLFEAATRAYPRSARAHMELGGAYGRAGRTADAEHAFARSVEVLPTYAAAWYNLGNLRARAGRLKEAEPAYRQAVTHAPQLVQAWYNLGLVEQMQGDLAAAEDAFAAAARIAPRDVEVRRALDDLRARAPHIANPPTGR